MKRLRMLVWLELLSLENGLVEERFEPDRLQMQRKEGLVALK